jgi:hypothetical protein
MARAAVALLGRVLPGRRQQPRSTVVVRAAEREAAESECAPCEFSVLHETSFGARVVLVGDWCDQHPAPFLSSCV